jgi:iron complex transport system ATP-binding protein
MGRVTGVEAVLAGFFASEILFLHHQVEAWMREKASAALTRVGASHLSDRKLNQMSTGEARRVVIARALVHEPSVLVLDEPTTGLDVVARNDFLEQLRNLAREGATLVFVTHHVEEVVPEIERVILLAGGRIMMDGPPESVLTSAALSEAYGADVTLQKHGTQYELRLAAHSVAGDSVFSLPVSNS